MLKGSPEECSSLRYLREKEELAREGSPDTAAWMRWRREQREQRPEVGERAKWWSGRQSMSAKSCGRPRKEEAPFKEKSQNCCHMFQT